MTLRETDEMATLARYHRATAVEEASRTWRYVVSLVTDPTVQVGPDTEVVRVSCGILLSDIDSARRFRDRGPSGVAVVISDHVTLSTAMCARRERRTLLPSAAGKSVSATPAWGIASPSVTHACGIRLSRPGVSVSGPWSRRATWPHDDLRNSPTSSVRRRLARAIWAPKSASPSC